MISVVLCEVSRPSRQKPKSYDGKFVTAKCSCINYGATLSSNVFERRASTGSGLFALMKRYFEQVFGQIVSVKVKTTNNTNLVASRLIKRENNSLPVDVRQSKTWLFKRSIGC